MAYGDLYMSEVSALSVLILGSLGFVLALSIRAKQRLAAVIIGLTIFHESFFVVFPVWYAATSDLRLERELLSSVGGHDILRVLVGEAIYCASFCVAFALSLFLGAPEGVTAGPTVVHETAEARTMMVVLLAGLIVYGSIVISPPPPFEDLQLVLQPDAGLLAQLAGWLNSLFFFTSLMAAALLIFDRSRHRKVVMSLALLLLGSVVYIGISSGARGRITWVVSVLFVAAVLKGTRRQILLSVGVAALAAPVVLALGNEARNAIIAATSLGASRTDVVRLLIEARRDGSVAERSDEGTGGVLAKRAEGPRNAVALYELHDRGGGPGLGIYLGSLLFPVPRRIWPGKPAPGSTTENFYDAAIYQVKTISYGSEGEMGPVLASAHAYWEGGWTAIPVLGILTGLLWGFLLRWSRKLPERLAIIVVTAFAASLLIDGFLTAFCPLWSFVLTVWRWTLPLLGIYGSFLYYSGVVSPEAATTRIKRHRPS